MNTYLTEVDLLKERIQVKKEQLTRQGLSIPEEKELVAETVGERMEDVLNEMPPGMDFIKPDAGMKTPFPSQMRRHTRRRSSQRTCRGPLKQTFSL